MKPKFTLQIHAQITNVILNLQTMTVQSRNPIEN